ncbi:MAG: cytochrome oxidase subunit III [Calditrichaeota bacterium]|nr:MAG: cytochrome oxidase subunit III [Calditrichota bacterium]MBL1204976.1 cytochrome oxidase subunit III [Calditrichota bacterium]NOG44806.1 c-type cytochrome [Calditrichota bacterium]
MKYEDKLLDHNYDGIQELDNSLPPWWLNLFYITIVWGVIYVFYYHVFDMGPLQIDEYNIEMGVIEESSSGLSGYQSPYADTGDKTPPPPPAGGEAATTETTESQEPVEEVPAINYDLVTDAGRLENGAKVYAANCLACHGANGEGGIGPNMTDNYWINGDGSFNSIVKVVQDGVPVKGMIAWKPVLKESDLLDVSSHMYNLIGTNPPNPKEPQGEKYGD